MSSELATKSGDEIFEEISRRVDASLGVDSSPTSLPIPTVSTTTSLDEVPLYQKSGNEIFEEISRRVDASLGVPDTAQPVAVPSDQPTYTMDDLDTNREWIKNAKTFHQHLEGEDWKGSDKSLAEWFKRRHAQLNNDIVNMGATALSVKDMDDVTKKALVDSMDMYDDTDNDWGSFWRSLRYVATDPTTLATIPFAIATGGTAAAAKIAGQRGVQVAARFALKDQIKKQLIEKGIGKEAAKEIIKTGASKEISKELIEQVVKDSAKKVALTTSGTGFAGAGAYGAAFDLADQSLDLNLGRVYDNDVYERYLEEGMSSEEARELSKVGDIDYKRLAIVTGISGLTGGGVNFGLSKWAARRMSKKVGNAAVRAERLAEAEAEALGQLAPSTTVVMSKVPKQIDDEITVASQKVEVDGDVIIDVPVEKTTPTTRTTKGTTPTGGQTTTTFEEGAEEVKGAAKKRLEKARKDKLKEIRKAIENNPNVKDTVEEVLPDGSVRFTSKKKATAELAEAELNIEGRTFVQRVLASSKRALGSGAGLGQAQKRRRERLDATRTLAERQVAQSLNRLQTAVKKDFNTKAENLDKETLTLIDSGFRGNADALSSLASRAPNVLEEVTLMRNNIKDLQKQLLETGAIKEGSELETRIIKSKDGDSELYVTTSYEKFDNPNFSEQFIRTDEGKKAVKDAKKLFSDQYKLIDNNYKSAKEAQDLKRILSQEQKDIINLVENEPEGYVNQQFEKILAVHDEGEFLTAFGQIDTPQAATKILSKKEEIPEVIRTLMGENKNPFQNYANTLSKLMQTVETINYEQAVAKAVKEGEIEGAATRIIAAQDITKPLTSRIPSRADITRPLQETTQDITSPLEGLFATPQTQAAIDLGNEFIATWGKAGQTYMLLQGYTRAAKTVYSTTAIMRNFIGGGYMAFGAGYLNRKNVKAMKDTARGMGLFPDEQLRAEYEKGVALGYYQAGIDLGTFRGALQDAGKEGFWDLADPVYKGKGFLKKSRQFAGTANRKAITLYQSMDDMWKGFANSAEKSNQRQVLIDKGINPDEVIRTLRSSDGIPIKITRLDEVAAGEVNKHMQNYNGVPQLLRRARQLPLADFISFKYEMLRTQGNILKSSFKDLREGSEQMKLGVRNPDGTLQGEAQRNLGRKRLGYIVAAQASAPALSLTSASLLGLEKKHEPDKKNAPENVYSIRQGIEYFLPDFAKGSGYFYSKYDPETGKGIRTSLSYINPWAASPQNDPLKAALRALDQGEYVDGAVDDALYRGILQPIVDSASPSMFFESMRALATGEDEYGRPLSSSPLWNDQAIARLKQAAKGFEAGIIKSGRDIYQGYKVGRTKSGREIRGDFALAAAATGIKPELFDINREVGFKLSGLVRDMGSYNNIFNEVVRDRTPRDTSEFVDAYKKVLDLQYARSTEIFDAISHARSAGLDNKDIFRAITDDGLFKNRFDKQILQNMIRTGKFIPKKPNMRDVSKWGQSIKRSTGYAPPTREVLQEIMNLYGQYSNTTTGVR